MESMNAEFLKLVEALPIARSPEDEAKIERLKHAPEPQREENQGLASCIGGWDIMLYPDGQYSLDKIDSPAGRNAQAPSAEEVRRAADAFVSRTKLLPEGAQFVRVYDCDTSEWGLGDKVVHSRGVVYACSLEGITRAGGFTVEVGPRSEIVSVTNKTRHTIPEQPLPILSPNEALEKLRSNECHMADGPSWDATAYVDSIKLMYWESILAMDLSYIMPVYIFEGEAVAPGKRSVRWKAHVEAVRPEFLEKKPVYKYHE
ncbi:MAG TPA: hypothetical protein VMX94_12545 [Armatimonadota bacterium]|nr:hypothetical protein [Armatimonadota bacterium]